MTTLIWMGGAGFAAGAGAGVGAGVGVLLVWQYRLRRQAEAIRAAVACVVATGASDLRVADGVRPGRLHALAESIDELIAASWDRCRQTEQSKVVQHQYWRRRYLQRRLGGEYTNRQAQSVVDESSGMTKLALMQVVEHAQAVLGTTRTIEESVRSVIERTQTVVESTSRAAAVLQDFERSFQRVGGITEFIATVAKQTSLLSLNAGIEAARAAAAGKGFGVVAQEVKALAAETAHSASEIAETVGLLRGEVVEMGNAIAGVTAGIAHIEDATATVNATVVGQRTTLEELDMCVHDVISQMDLLAMLAHDLDRRRHPPSPSSLNRTRNWRTDHECLNSGGPEPKRQPNRKGGRYAAVPEASKVPVLQRQAAEHADDGGGHQADVLPRRQRRLRALPGGCGWKDGPDGPVPQPHPPGGCAAAVVVCGQQTLCAQKTLTPYTDSGSVTGWKNVVPPEVQLPLPPEVRP